MSRLQGPDGTGGPHIFVDDLHYPVASDADAHHLTKALRVRAGDPMTVSDGQGSWRACRYGATIALDGDIVKVAPPAYQIGVAFALVKGSKPELATQKLTELGVDRIILVAAERSVAKWDDAKVSKNLERLRRVASEASMQSRRLWLPEVSGVMTLSDLLDDSAQVGGAVALAEPGGCCFTGTERLVVVGPEGGWTPTELGLANQTVALGSTILRAETAAIVAGATLAQVRDGFVRVVDG